MRWESVVIVMPEPHFTPKERSVSKEAVWAPELVWMQRLEEESFAPARD
jgi:hypothetical protein